MRPAASTRSPVIAAAGSPWPQFALTPPNASGSGASPRACSIAACSEPASIGSPSAVPVPCASSRETDAAVTPASANAACSSARCAEPLGAVRLALRPSCRTAAPHNHTERPGPGDRCRAAAPQASPRTKPSARASNVKHRPFTEVMPATANAMPTAGSNIRLTASSNATSHSRSCTARHAAWPAANAEEQAVSYETQGPCSPRMNDRRPAAME
eukprot:scaffold17709_cov81-Phaeocystis_antarctica.AAC.1